MGQFSPSLVLWDDLCWGYLTFSGSVVGSFLKTFQHLVLWEDLSWAHFSPSLVLCDDFSFNAVQFLYFIRATTSNMHVS